MLTLKIPDPFYMKHFQHFPKPGLLAAKVTVFARKCGGDFSVSEFCSAKPIQEKDKSRKQTLKFPQVALADSVHVGEKIAQCRNWNERKSFGVKTRLVQSEPRAYKNRS